ncbi:hypothetical protein B0H13DRAFT_2276899 [Mycena leptocephala]|nr:hypothetical protein B0H13DRAFT_2276899 [Mycena leptocephala]
MEQPRSPTRHRRRSGTAHRTPTRANPIFPTALVSSIAHPAPLLTESARYSDSLDAPAASPTRPPARGFLALRGAAVRPRRRDQRCHVARRSLTCTTTSPLERLPSAHGPPPLRLNPPELFSPLPFRFSASPLAPHLSTLSTRRCNAYAPAINVLVSMTSPSPPPSAIDQGYCRIRMILDYHAQAASRSVPNPRRLSSLCCGVAYDMRCDYQQRRLLAWALYRTRTSRARHSTTTYSPNYATLAFLATHVASVASPFTTSVSSALSPAARRPRPPRTANRIRSPPSSPVPPLSPPCTLGHLQQEPALIARRARLGASPTRHLPPPASAAHAAGAPLRRLHRLATNRDRLQLECVAPPPPRTTIDTDPHAPDALLVRRGRPTHHAQPTMPPLAFDADVLITCPFTATILVAIRPSRSTPPLLHGESGAHHHARVQRSRRPFLITNAALFGCERTTTSVARDGPQLFPHAPGCFANTLRTTPRSSCPPSLAPRSPPPRPPRPSPGLPPPPPLDTTACLYLGTSPTTRVRGTQARKEKDSAALLRKYDARPRPPTPPPAASTPAMSRVIQAIYDLYCNLPKAMSIINDRGQFEPVSCAVNTGSDRLYRGGTRGAAATMRELYYWHFPGVKCHIILYIFLLRAANTNSASREVALARKIYAKLLYLRGTPSLTTFPTSIADTAPDLTALSLEESSLAGHETGIAQSAGDTGDFEPNVKHLISYSPGRVLICRAIETQRATSRIDWETSVNTRLWS